MYRWSSLFEQECFALLLTFLLIQGWLKRDDIILLGTLSSRKPRVKSFSVSHSSFTPVETEYVMCCESCRKVIARRLRAKFWPDCAIPDTSMKFGTAVDHD